MIAGGIVFVVVICLILSEKYKLGVYDCSQQQNRNHKCIHGIFHMKTLSIMSLFQFGYGYLAHSQKPRGKCNRRPNCSVVLF